MTDDRIPVTWTPRGAPLIARAVAAVGPAARALADRLAALDDAALGALAAVASTGAGGDAGGDVLIVLGAAEALPWVDGVAYLGRDDAAPELLLPTALAPSVPPAVLARAIHAAVRHPGPIAVIPARPPPRLVPCGVARAIDRGRLVAWRAARQAARQAVR